MDHSHPPAFARAKIQQPRLRIEQIPRPNLESRLARALGERALVLLSAPAGYGKTVLLSRVLGQPEKDRAVAWISVDEEDDLQRLVLALVTALEPWDLPWRMAPVALSALVAEGQRAALDALLDALAGSEAAGGIIVLEDIHRLGDASLFEWLDKLVAGLPENWCLALTSRIDPPLALARLRGRGELAEFRAEDLRFTRAEAQSLAATSPDLDASAVDALWQRTHGWPVGLHLALRTGQANRAGWTAERHAFDYLASEVLALMPAGLQSFLLRCSVLPELTRERCQAVSGDAQAGLWLDEIERRGLFVTALDDGERTLRLHDLFREFLEEQLARRQGDELPGLLERAAAGEEDPVRRVGYLLRAQALDAAEQALAVATPSMLLDGAIAQVLRLLEQFPAARRHASPLLAYIRGQCAWPNFDWVTLQHTMQLAGDGFGRAGQHPMAQQARAFEALALLNLGRLDEASDRLAAIPIPSDNPELAAFSELLRYWDSGARGPLEGPGHHLERMLDHLERQPSPELWHRCLPHFLFLGNPGVSAPMARYVDQALLVAGDAHPQLRAGALTLKAWLLMWDARLDEAEAVLALAEEDARWLGRPTNLHHPITVVHGVIHALRGERAQRDGAVATLGEVDTGVERRRTWEGIFLYQVSRWYLVSDDWEVVGILRQQLNDKPTTGEWPYVGVARAALNGLWALHSQQPEQARALLEPVLEAADRYDITATRSNLRVTLALALARLGELSRAWEVLAPAVAQARQPGEKLSLLLSGASLLAELAAQPWPASASLDETGFLREMADLAADLRRDGRKDTPVQAPVPSSTTGHAADALSPREWEVLTHLAAGTSNKLIARQLDLSPHTVKRHVANILDKLGLATRGQAAAWMHTRQQAA
jgi:LuxR family transcriptional regulator, maltose regulon positive regulatory protein